MASLPDGAQTLSARSRLHALITHHFSFLDQTPESAQFLYQTVAASGVPAAGFHEHLYARVLEILEQGADASEFEVTLENGSDVLGLLRIDHDRAVAAVIAEWHCATDP